MGMLQELPLLPGNLHGAEKSQILVLMPGLYQNKTIFFQI